LKLKIPFDLSVLGTVHTFISVIAILTALVALWRQGKINTLAVIGKLYIVLTIAACITAFPLIKTGHPTIGHLLPIMILLLLATGIYAKSMRVFGKLYDYVQVITLSSTVFLSLAPAVVETLTRVPVHHPIATRPGAPIVVMGLMLLTLLFLTVIQYQVIRLKMSRSFYIAPRNKIRFHTTFMSN
jgi:hypothetical protein